MDIKGANDKRIHNTETNVFLMRNPTKQEQFQCVV